MKSNYAGKCKGMKTEQGIIIHEWKPGDEIFYQKDPKCICINEECFKKQQENASGQTLSNKTVAVPQRDLETRTKDAREQLEMLWPMCLQKACVIYHPDYDIQKASQLQSDDTHFKDILILAQCLFKGLSYRWAT